MAKSDHAISEIGFQPAHAGLPYSEREPFSIKYTLELVPDSEIAENVRAEDEKDGCHIGKQ
jgi:hypothetical protein